jgi:hypothetical protein
MSETGGFLFSFVLAPEAGAAVCCVGARGVGWFRR